MRPFFAANIVRHLKENLGKVKIITGSLKIKRSFPIMSLDFFESLEMIEGIQPVPAKGEEPVNKYSLEISENENLQKLFPILPDGSSVKIQWRRSKIDHPVPSGKALIHFNPNLCYSEIDRMVNASGLQKPKDEDISKLTNGDKAVCSQNKLKLTLRNDISPLIFVNFDSYQNVIVGQSDHR